MCHFITMILPGKTDLAAAAEVFSRHHRNLTVLNNRHIEPLLLPDEIYFQPAGKMCDCGTALGSLRQKPDKNLINTKMADKFRKRGWSEAKIQRWMGQQKQIKERDDEVYRVTASAVVSGDPDGWGQILSSLIRELHLPYAGILLHWYSGGLQTELIKIKGRVPLLIDEHLSNALYRMEQDTLYVVKNSPSAVSGKNHA